MVLFLIELGKYINIVLLGLYTLLSFVALKKKDTDPKNGYTAGLSSLFMSFLQAV